ncbi:UPF0481 protein At3g47200-like [Impatiens glandulifera]|uniref:UPF0481 protein At3g47200-like n=1 Tax=Impatiens glandulifera TaxID=253017 RepID=UPI001FB13A28|nr:UPF0481 protein At3g47200-like [Impatiens glandulifera]
MLPNLDLEYFQYLHFYRVPDDHKRGYEESFSPRLVSIGQLHHGKPHLQHMESYKLRFLDSYIKRMGCDFSLEALTTFAMKWINCKLPEDGRNISNDEFVKMMLLDGAVVVEVLLIRSDIRSIGMNKSLLVVMNLTNGIEEDLKHDMLLLENQLPLRFIEYLLSFLSEPITIYKLLLDNFNFGFAPIMASSNSFSTDFGCLSFVELLRRMITGIDKKIQCHGDYIQICCATQLLEAGVKFKGVKGHHFIKDIKFSNGELLMPPFIINNHTETLLRNIIAYEKCSKRNEYICSYVMLLHSLLDTVKDVDLLVEEGIIVNHFGRNEKVLELFNSFYTVKLEKYRSDDFYFHELCNALNTYSKSIWHQWKAKISKWKIILMRDYFSNPWTVISVIGAIILLLLTIAQTICSILSL